MNNPRSYDSNQPTLSQKLEYGKNTSQDTKQATLSEFLEYGKNIKQWQDRETDSIQLRLKFNSTYRYKSKIPNHLLEELKNELIALPSQTTAQIKLKPQLHGQK